MFYSRFFCNYDLIETNDFSCMQSIPKALNCLTKGSGIAEAKCLCPVKSITQLDRVEVNCHLWGVGILYKSLELNGSP